MYNSVGLNTYTLGKCNYKQADGMLMYPRCNLRSSVLQRLFHHNRFQLVVMQDRKEQLHFTLVQNNVFWLLYIKLGGKTC